MKIPHAIRFSLTAALAALALPALAAAQGTPPVATPPSAGPAPAARGRQSWTSDRMPLAVGDIITVNVDEHLLASADRRNSADDQRSRDMGFNLAQGTGTGMNASINSQNNGHSQDEGQASRTNDFVGSVTARVVGVSPTGLLQITGSKVVKLDKNSEELTISGWIRSDDVASDNTIESWRIADAQLAYHATGDLNKPKGSIIARILGWIWP